MFAHVKRSLLFFADGGRERGGRGTEAEREREQRDRRETVSNEEVYFMSFGKSRKSNVIDDPSVTMK